MDDILSCRKDLPDDLACFLQQQKQRQARLETTMRSFPSTDMEQDKADFKKKRNAHEASIIFFIKNQNLDVQKVSYIFSYHAVIK